MDPLEAEVVHSAVGIGWYPLELYGKLLRTIDRQLGNGDLRAIPAMRASKRTATCRPFIDSF
jgi:hypothetical protein